MTSETDPKIPALRRDRLDPNRYEYLSVEDSKLLDRAAGGALTAEEGQRAVLRLLIEKARASRSAHQASRY